MSEDLQPRRELILISGVEGGGVTLYGERTECGWRYYSSFVDQTPLMLSEEEDRREIRRESHTVQSWEDALALLDQMGWLRLPAVMVHRDFREKVWEAVQSRLDWEGENVAKLERWRERCNISLN